MHPTFKLIILEQVFEVAFQQNARRRIVEIVGLAAKLFSPSNSRLLSNCGYVIGTELKAVRVILPGETHTRLFFLPPDQRSNVLSPVTILTFLPLSFSPLRL